VFIDPIKRKRRDMAQAAAAIEIRYSRSARTAAGVRTTMALRVADDPKADDPKNF